jgi:hypothetical protein
MERITPTYLASLLATLLVFAGLMLVFQEAHCFGRTLDTALSHATYHAAHGEGHGAIGSHEKHNCDHDKNIPAHENWAIAQPPQTVTQIALTAFVKLNLSNALTGTSTFVVPEMPKSTAPPHRARTFTSDDVLTVTGRLLI